MSNDQQTKRKPYEPIVFDDPKLKLYGLTLAGAEKKPSLRWKMIENNPALDIDYGTKDSNGRRVTHQTPLDPVEINKIMELIKLVATSKIPKAFLLDNWGHPFFWSKEQQKMVRSENKMNISQLEIGKKETGEVYLKYISYNKPELEFIFCDGDWHQLKDQSNDPMASIESIMAAKAWAQLIQDVYNVYFTTTWVEPEWRKKFRLELAQKYGNNSNSNWGQQNQSQSCNNSNSGGGWTQQTTSQPQQQEEKKEEVSFDNYDDEIAF